MSDYEYTDRDKDKLIVVNAARYKSDILYVGVMRRDQEFGVDVRNEDAPAIALAILEAAGCDKAGKTRLSRAMIALIEHSSAEKVRAEREAEDAKVREFRESSLSAIASVFNGSNVDAKEWAALSETGRESWYARYRAARKFFEEA